MNSTLVRLLRFLKPYLGQVVLSILAGLATIASGTALMSTAAYLIAAAALQPSIADLQVAIVGVRAFGISRGIFRYTERLLSHTVNLNLLAGLRVWFYRRIEPLAPARLQTRRSGDLLSSAVADIETLENLYVRVVAPAVVALLVGVGMFLFLKSFDLRLALTLIAFLAAAGVGLPVLSHALARRPGVRLVNSRARLNAQVIETLQGAADLLVYGQAGSHIERLTALEREFAAVQRQMAWIRGLHSLLATGFTQMAGWSLLVLSIPLIRLGRLDAVYLATIVLGSLASFEAVLPLPLAAQYLVSSLQAGRRLFALADAPAPVTDPVTPLPIPRTVGLSVRGLRFGYLPGDENLILKGLDLEIPAGGSAVLLGASGSGKTTLTQLILRFWDYREGEIRLADQDLHCYAQDEIRARIAIIAQSTFLFNTSIRQNLLLANPDATLSQIETACRQAQIHEWIAGLPDGYETHLGERGLRLSGGERQRIAIARAILKDAPFLILDEPVASLDAETARQVMDTLVENALPGRTTLLITHHLSGLERMGVISILKDGRIAEQGTHAQLLRSAGIYARMWQAQNRLVTEPD